MRSLYVLYDDKCELCTRLKDWLLSQSPWIRLGLVPAGSDEARQMFPGLEQLAGTSDLVVISDAGEVYLNNHAWIMCLYALEEYRDWAMRLASPLLLPLARKAFATLSKNRATISRWVGSTEEQVAAELKSAPEEACSTAECRKANSDPADSVRDYLQ